VSIPADRRDRLRDRVRAAGLDAALVTRLVNVRYLTGFTGSSGALLLPADPDRPDVLCTDGRYTTQAGAQTPDVELLIDRASAPALAAVAATAGVGRLGYESHDVTVDLAAVLAERAEGAELVSVRQAVEAMRAVKDDDEVALLREACTIADRALAELLAAGGLRAGRTEREVGRDLDSLMLDGGADAPSFETIVAAGPNSAIPHHRPTRRVLERGDLVKLDFGATYRGYHSDMTRTLVLGEPSAWQREVYELVRTAQAAGRATRPHGRSSPPPAMRTRSPTALVTASGSRSTRRRRSARRAPVHSSTGWPSPSSRGSTSRGAGASASRTPWSSATAPSPSC
jgi:Xaa-Pro aminopeptidase